LRGGELPAAVVQWAWVAGADGGRGGPGVGGLVVPVVLVVEPGDAFGQPAQGIHQP
jgi:hypothetical protein